MRRRPLRTAGGLPFPPARDVRRRHRRRCACRCSSSRPDPRQRLQRCWMGHPWLACSTDPHCTPPPPVLLRAACVSVCVHPCVCVCVCSCAICARVHPGSRRRQLAPLGVVGRPTRRATLGGVPACVIDRATLGRCAGLCSLCHALSVRRNACDALFRPANISPAPS